MSEWIPLDQLAPPQAVWAEVSESVRAVRERLRNLGGYSQYNAPILVRLPDGRAAPTAVPMLRKLAQEQGLSILDQQLGDLLEALCPEPWGVESRGPDYREAHDAASLRRLPVIALEGGRAMGLMLPPSHRALSVMLTKEDFDLFDESLDRDELARVRFVRAALHTTVAQVARHLKSVPDPENAYVVVGPDDGPFRVSAARDLNGEVKRLGTGAWNMPLRQFEPRLRPAPNREFHTVGQKQAQTLADKGGFLVVTEAGQVAGLLLGRVVRLSGDVPSTYTAREPAYDLFDVPQQVLDGYPDQVRPEKKPRYTNLWFADAAGRTVPHSSPLTLGRPHRLQVNIGQPRQESIVRGEPPPIVEPPQEAPEGTRLYVSLFWDEGEFNVAQPTQVLLLPPWGDSLPVEFEVTPRRRTFGPNDRVALDVHLYYRCNLVQAWRIQVEVVPAGQSAHSDAPQAADPLAARTEDYMAVEEIGPRHLSLTIDRAPDGAYRFDFVVAADEQADEVRLPCRVTLRREDLTHLITKARRQLYNIARSPDYQGNVAGTAATYGQAMRALATIGRQLYLKLFKPRERDSSAAAVAAWIQQGNLKPDSTIQIVDRAGDFVFPWALVYDRSPWDGTAIDPQGFWGVRYQIELLTEKLVRRYQQLKPVIEAEQVSLSVGLYDYLPGAEQQKAFFRQLGGAGGARVKANLLNTTRHLRRALQTADQHLIYFFCHGFTERMAADIQLGDDLIAEFKAWHQTLPEEQRARVQDAMSHYDALFDVSDSWLQLTRGTAPLTMMEDTLLAANARFDNGPLVFLNMCESAQVLPSLSDGFIPFFIDHGARGVIGTECPMTSTFADPFAQAFFRRLFQGQPAGKILLDLRREFLTMGTDPEGGLLGNPLGLAYTLYCDADVHLAENVTVPELAQTQTD